MKPKEKAKELVDRFGKKVGKELKNGSFRYNIEIAKQCALIAVDEVIENEYDEIQNEPYEINNIRYWELVKQEIEKL